MAKPKQPQRNVPNYRETVTPDLIERLESGRSLLDVCKDDDMPSADTVYAWMKADEGFGLTITRAREYGFYNRGERAVDAAKSADDAVKGRLAFDAERWFLGKVSKAFKDKSEIDHKSSDGSMTPQAPVYKIVQE